MSSRDDVPLPPFFRLSVAEGVTSMCVRHQLAVLTPGLHRFIGLCYQADESSVFHIFSAVPVWQEWFASLTTATFPIVLTPRLTITGCQQVDWTSVSRTQPTQWGFRTRCRTHYQEVPVPPDHPAIQLPTIVSGPPAPPLPPQGPSVPSTSYARSVRGRPSPPRLGHAWSDSHEPAVRPSDIVAHRFMSSVTHRDLSVVLSLPSPRVNLADTLTACLRLLGWKPAHVNPFMGIEKLDNFQYVLVCSSTAQAHTLIEAGDVVTADGVVQIIPASDDFRLFYLQPLPIYVTEDLIADAFGPYGDIYLFKRATICHQESGLQFPTNKGKVLLHLTSELEVPSELFIAGLPVRVQADMPFTACGVCGSLAHADAHCDQLVCSNCHSRGHVQADCAAACKVCHRSDHRFLQCPKRRTGPPGPVTSVPSRPPPVLPASSPTYSPPERDRPSAFPSPMPPPDVSTAPASSSFPDLPPQPPRSSDLKPITSSPKSTRKRRKKEQSPPRPPPEASSQLPAVPLQDPTSPVEMLSLSSEEDTHDFIPVSPPPSPTKHSLIPSLLSPLSPSREEVPLSMPLPGPSSGSSEVVSITFPAGLPPASGSSSEESPPVSLPCPSASHSLFSQVPEGTPQLSDDSETF